MFWLIAYAWRKPEMTSWSFTNDATNMTPCEWILDGERLAKQFGSGQETTFISATPITEAEYKKLRGIL
ncbi:MAG TPA: hypothetical protein VF681_14645 [Abditibacteriaceae bacterium]